MSVQYKVAYIPDLLVDVEGFFNDLGDQGWELISLSEGGQALFQSGSSIQGISLTGSLIIPPGTISSSAFSSPSQGTVRAVINGSTTDVDLGVQTGDAVTFASVSTTGNITAGGNLISSNSSGDEGGEILLAKAQTNTTLTGSGITIDSYQNKFRIFEQGGTARGGYFDLTTLDANAGTDLTKAAIGALSYGQWFSVTTQSGSANTSASVTFDSQSFARGFTLVNGSRITALQAGTYNFQFSLQLKNASNDNILYNIWFSQNGVNEDWSNTIYEIDKQPSTFGSNVAALNYMKTMTSGSYLELKWSADDAGARIFATGSVSNPSRPGVPSAIMTVTQVG